jgi:hypothetical protein
MHSVWCGHESPLVHNAINHSAVGQVDSQRCLDVRDCAKALLRLPTSERPQGADPQPSRPAWRGVSWSSLQHLNACTPRQLPRPCRGPVAPAVVTARRRLPSSQCCGVQPAVAARWEGGHSPSLRRNRVARVRLRGGVVSIAVGPLCRWRRHSAQLRLFVRVVGLMHGPVTRVCELASSPSFGCTHIAWP